MRYLTLIILVSLISGCSFWPFGKEKTGSCLDDDSCDTPASLEQQLVTNATWYCYGVSRDDGWDCSQEEDQTRIAVIPDPASPTPMGSFKARPMPLHRAADPYPLCRPPWCSRTEGLYWQQVAPVVQ